MMLFSIFYIQSLKNQLAATKNELAATKNELAATKNELAATENELQEKASHLEDLRLKLKEEVEEKQEFTLELFKLTGRNYELETELKNAVDKSGEHEERANTIHQRNLELESFIQTSDSKAEEANKKASELNLLLETEKYRIKELEEQISLLDKKSVSGLHLEAKKKDVLLLENQVKDLEQKLQLADSKSKEKDIGGATSELKDETTIKSREIDSLTSTPKRRSKKKSEGTSAQAVAPAETHASPSLNINFILGVALVSVIIGVILGKRY